MIQYEYDAAGNRFAVTDNGVRTPYVTNDLNQYLQVGSDVRTYDTDGNLKTDAADGATYAYDDENRLVSVVDASGSVQYEYDALGNRIAKVEGGVRTEYLPDPTGLTNVVAEYDASGNVIARYVHGGFGLVSRHDAGGSVAFYDHDALGSTAALTGSDGSAVNTYSYLPFGEALTHSETVPNPFEYVGQFGVQRDGNGLDYMRARYYSSDDGRFINEDPIGVAGGLNLYNYTRNSPTDSIDPLGLQTEPSVPVTETIELSIDLYVEAVLDGGIEVHQALELYVDEAVEFVQQNPELMGLAGVAARFVGTSASLLAKALAPYVGAVALGAAAGYAAGTGFNEIAEFTSGMTLGDAICDLTDCDEPDFGFPAPPGDPLDDGSTRQVAARDPNDITGPAGFGPEQFVREETPFPYVIRFENLAAATAAAQTVTVTQQLDADFDFTTFELVSFGLGDTEVLVPADRTAFTVRFDLRPSNDLLLDIGADFNLQTGLLTWTFTSLDPDTGELTEDPLAGFLPPNVTAPEGEGFVSYFVRPKATLATGTHLDAQARIVFDVNAPIDTPPIFHTIDAGAPTSSINPLPPTVGSAVFPLSWSGTDDPSGAGLASFDIFVSVDGGAFTPLLVDTIATSAIFSGAAGHTYAFYSVAADNVGHVENPPTTADATTQVVVLAGESDFGDAPDSYGTLLASGGARHLSGSALRLGSARDGESDGQPGPLADGDDLAGTSDDEDGVALPSVLIARLNAAATVTASQAGLLDAWIDFNANGTFDPSEQIAAGVALPAGANRVTFAVPEGAQPGFTYARFRLSTAGGLAPTGPADDGEIEDYRLFIDAVSDRGSRIFPDPENPGQDVWVVVGTTANDRIEFGRPSKHGNVQVKRNGRSFASANLAQFDRIAAFGLSGNDQITVHSRIADNADLFGDSGNDTLKGGKGNDRLHGGTGNDKVFGYLGIDLLLGDTGNDHLDGGRGRDLLIGGAGRDKLFGHDDDDLLIAGTTAHDQNARALAAILAEWTSSRDYAARTANILAGNGPALAGTGIFLQQGVSVDDDGVRDELFGNGGKDWFFASLAQDKLSRAKVSKFYKRSRRAFPPCNRARSRSDITGSDRLPGRRRIVIAAAFNLAGTSMKPVNLLLICAMVLVGVASLSSAAGPNVLFIAADDLRPQLGCYGDRTVKSPHLDALARRGMVFERCYVQQALCSPSRIAMLSGRYPATTGIFEIGRPLRATMPDITTLPQHFKNHGYHTRSLGKIYHVGIDDDASWTIPAWHSKQPRYGPIGRAAIEAQRKDDELKGIKRQGRAKGVGNYASPAFEMVDCGDDDLLDGDTAAAAIAQLREHAKNRAAVLPRRRLCQPACSVGQPAGILGALRPWPVAPGSESIPAQGGARVCHDARSGFPLVCERARGRTARKLPARMPPRLPGCHKLHRCPGRPTAGRARRNGPRPKHDRRVLERPRLLHGRAHVVGHEAQQLRRRHSQLPHHCPAGNETGWQKNQSAGSIRRPCADADRTLRPSRAGRIRGPQPEGRPRRSGLHRQRRRLQLVSQRRMVRRCDADRRVALRRVDQVRPRARA